MGRGQRTIQKKVDSKENIVMDRIRVMIYDKKSRTLICWKEYYNLKEAERYCESVKKLKEIFVRCQQVK